jgi:hypothetical protein
MCGLGCGFDADTVTVKSCQGNNEIIEEIDAKRKAIGR